MPRLPKAAAAALLTVASALAALGASRLALLETFERRTVDYRFRALGDQGAASDEIVLVAIDDASLKTLEPAVGRWPWPRDVHAVLLDFLGRAGARLVVFDLLFTERDADYPEGDAELARATADSGRVVHAVYLGRQQVGEVEAGLIERFSLPRAGGFDVFAGADPPLPPIARGARALGHVTTALDADGPWRRYLLLAGHGERLVPSLALASALAARGLDLSALEIGEREVSIAGTRVPLDADWRLPIWFHGGPGTYRKESYGELFFSELQIAEGEPPGLDPALFRDKIVVVGLSAAGLHDLFTTPYSGGRGDDASPGGGGSEGGARRGGRLGAMQGFEIHANVIDALMAGRFLDRAPAWQVVALVFLAAAATLGLALGARLRLAIPGFALVPILYLGVVYWDFGKRYELPVVPVLLSWAIAMVLGLVYQYTVESAEKRKVKQIFSRYASPDVYAELLANPAAAELGGTRRVMSVLFSDIRGFTSFSESRPPEEVIEQLNEYFAAMVEEIFAHRGTVDKFVGDMVMALFGAPLDDPDHADDAVACALAMQRRLRELNAGWARRGRAELAGGIGIHSGEMLAGNLGSERIQSYTVIGDNVNLASRIESLTKEYGAEILVSEATASALTADYGLIELGEVTVRGKTEPVKIFRVPVPG